MTEKTHKPIAIFYGSSTCYTEMSAEKIANVLGASQVDIYNITDEPLSSAQFYDHIIFGIPTWDYGELQEDWEEVWPELDELNLSGKKVAIYGQGDQIGYPEWFIDAVGYLHKKLIHAGADVVGYWPTTGYEFDESKALTSDKAYFLGLALDDENQFELSEARIQQWCNDLHNQHGYPKV